MSDVSDISELNISSIESAQPTNVSGPIIGGEHLKLILLSAMFSLSVLVTFISNFQFQTITLDSRHFRPRKINNFLKMSLIPRHLRNIYVYVQLNKLFENVLILKVVNTIKTAVVLQ